MRIALGRYGTAFEFASLRGLRRWLSVCLLLGAGAQQGGHATKMQKADKHQHHHGRQPQNIACHSQQVGEPRFPRWTPRQPFTAPSPLILLLPDRLSRSIHLPAVLARPGMRVPGLRAPHTERTESRLLYFQRQVLGLPLEGAGVHGGDGDDLTRYVAWDSPRALIEARSPKPEGKVPQLSARFVADDHFGSGHALAVAAEYVGFAVGALHRDLELDDLAGTVGSFRLSI